MILMIYRNEACREFVLPGTDNTDWEILIDKNEFELKHNLRLSLEVIEQKWSITSRRGKYSLIKSNAHCGKVQLCGGDIISIKTEEGSTLRCIVADRERTLPCFSKFIIGRNVISVGSDRSCMICYGFLGLVSKRHCLIYSENGHTVLEDTSSNGTFVNNMRVRGRRVLAPGDVIDVFGLKIVCFGDIIAAGSMFSEINVSDAVIRYTVPAVEDGSLEGHAVSKANNFNRSPRIFREMFTEEIAVEPPTAPQTSKKRSLLGAVGPSFTMAIPMLLGCLLTIFSASMGGSGASAFMFTGIITSVGSAVMGAVWVLYNIRETKRREAEDETERFNVYANYLVEIAEFVKDKYVQNYEVMHDMYPSADVCAGYGRENSRLWCRNPSHEDFLFCRLGEGDVDFQAQIKVPKDKFSIVYDSLRDKPQVLYDSYKTLRGVPVGVDLGKTGLVGIAGGRHKAGAAAVVDNIAAQIAANICYTDVKLAFCFDERFFGTGERWSYAKWLPHTWSENHRTRYFAANRRECADVFFELANIMRMRAENTENGSRSPKRHRPHYILFVSDASLLEGELISKYVFDTENNVGLTTIILTDYYRNLPNVCENIIQNDGDFCGFYNVASQSTAAVETTLDAVSPQRLLSFAKGLASVSVREMEDDSSVAQSLDFFEMYGAHRLSDFNVSELWQKNRTFNTMRALVGKKAGGADCYLDIHEKYHGPHGLVAGTTGSGKSELIQTFILSLAINFSPNDVAFFIIDFKGGGMANLFVDLPHMAGQISNLSGNQVRRAMISIKSENLRRQKLFNEYGVNNINNYTRLFKSGEAQTPIPHLVIIIDEFAELKKEEPDFMRELISVAQVGRSLGVHLILATQKPSGTVDDNIWSNAKFRLCLRVQDRQDSTDMLHKPDAAYITQAGRCYLQVGNDEIYELFQSGWSGAPYDSGGEGKREIATMITSTGKTAIVGSHVKMKRKERERFKWYLFLYNAALSAGSDVIFSDDADVRGRAALGAIRQARADGYNISEGSSEINAVKNFISLIPHDASSAEDAVKRIADAAAQSGVKLPEPKEKTQLEAVVEYLAQCARKGGYSFRARLWMPLLGSEILLSTIAKTDFDGWQHFDSWSLSAPVGVYDDPENQTQLPLTADLAENGHLAVCGSVVTGKSTLVQTLIYSLALKYSPDFVNFYILDFSGGMLGCFEQMPHTGGVLRENDGEKIGRFFNMINSVTAQRKKLFNGGNYRQYVRANGIKLPALVIAIDNFAGFKEKTENAYESNLIHIAREGVSYGIYLVLTSAGFGLAEIQNRIGDNIRTVLSLEMGDKFKYMDVMRVTHVDVIPESGIKGRGVAFVDGRLLEFQAALAEGADDDYKRGAKIEAMCRKMRDMWSGKPARQVPFIPENPTYDELCSLDEYTAAVQNKARLPFAYGFADASVYSVNLLNTYCYSITGKRRTGKTNLLRLLICAAAEKHGQCVVIEEDANELKALSERLGCNYISDDRGIFDYFNSLTGEFVARNKFKHECEESGMSDARIFEKMSERQPVFIFIADMNRFLKSVYHPGDGITNMSGFFENIIEKGSLHNIYFFACINSDEHALMAGERLYRLFTAYKTGVHLGGNLGSQRIFTFQNIHFSQLNKTTKKGQALTPSEDDETVAVKIVVPLAGGREV